MLHGMAPALPQRNVDNQRKTQFNITLMKQHEIRSHTNRLPWCNKLQSSPCRRSLLRQCIHRTIPNTVHADWTRSPVATFGVNISHDVLFCRLRTVDTYALRTYCALHQAQRLAGLAPGHHPSPTQYTIHARASPQYCKLNKRQEWYTRGTHVSTDSLKKLEQKSCRLSGHVASHPHRPHQLLHQRRANLQEAKGANSRQKHTERNVLALERCC